MERLSPEGQTPTPGGAQQQQQLPDRNSVLIRSGTNIDSGVLAKANEARTFCRVRAR